MKYHVLSILFSLFVLALSGCSSAPVVSAANAPSPEPPAVQDQASLIAALETAGATVEVGDPITQPFFTAQGSVLKVNGADVQVFEYPSSEAMENEASQVAPDGGSVGTSMMMWMEAPHFYKAGRVLALYVGSDAAVLDLLEKTLGAQFAGR